ncbi:MAG: TIGR03790 family protein [Phycisphaerae bacterium]|nr:TIGR03790 family protein [Phycisphaerae bacterium]
MKKFLLMALFFVPVGPSECWALAPDEIAVIANASSSDSMAVANDYCVKRNVPPSHIISIKMSLNERVSRKEYEDSYVGAIREKLIRPEMAGIKCLVTVYGVPLRIARFVPSGDLGRQKKLIEQLLDERFAELKELSSNLNAFSEGGVAPSADMKTFRMPRYKLGRGKEAVTLYRQATEAFTAAAKALSRMGTSGLGIEEKVKKMTEMSILWYGLQGRYQALEQHYKKQGATGTKKAVQLEMEAVKATLLQGIGRLKEISGDTNDWTTLKERFDLIYQIAGLQVICHPNHSEGLVSRRANIGDDDSESAFDSELALVLWDQYPLNDQQPNPMLVFKKKGFPVLPADRENARTFMVSRLDGPTPKIALELIERAIAAERMPIKGTAYIDARGIYTATEKIGSYGYYDDKLRKLARLIEKETALKVVENNVDSLFAVGECPDTVLYCGWYSLRNYIDSFTYNLGAIGYHIASFEAETLGRDKKKPDSNVWCKRMLEKGVTATLGATSEPYLHSFPRPDELMGELMGGKYCLVECFYRTLPFTSWRIILIGDPLYKPRYARARGFRPAM